MNSIRARSLTAQVLGALLGASVGSTLAAFLDARAVALASKTPLLEAWLASAGLLAPLAPVLGVGVGFGL